jgi:FkbM family methyltransferase
MVPTFAKRIAKSSLNTLGYTLLDTRKNNDLRVFLPGHLKSLLASLKINCVIDVGANVGEYGLMLRRIGYRGRIVSIEPVSDVFETLSATAASDDEWITLKTACGTREESRSIKIFHANVLSSFLPPSSNMSVVDAGLIERSETVSVKRLDSLFDEAIEGLDDPRVFLKTDAQGFDLDVLKGAGECIQRIDGLQLEVAVIPLYVGVPDYLEVLSYSRTLGFEPTGFFPILNSPTTGHLIECDVVLTRRHWSNSEQALVESNQSQ